MKKRILFGVFIFFSITLTYKALSNHQPPGLPISDDSKNYRIWCQDTLSYRGCGVGNGPTCTSIKGC